MPYSKEQRKALIALGNRIKEIRTAKGLSQRRLADYMGKDRQSLHRIEKGLVNAGSLCLLEICEALEIKLEELFKGFH